MWIGLALTFLVGVSGSAQEQHFYRIGSGTTSVITAMSPDGWLTWSNAIAGGTCTVEHATTLGLTLAGIGHDITLGFLPYANWHSQIDEFQLNQQNAYGKSVLEQANSEIHIEALLNYPKAENLPPEIMKAVERTAYLDTQYTEQIEEVSVDSDLYRFRLERNTTTAQITYSWLKDKQPEALIVPNGLILEFGVVFQVALYLDIPVTTYEFGEQKERVWLAQNKSTEQYQIVAKR